MSSPTRSHFGRLVGAVLDSAWPRFVRPRLFQQDAESVHERTMAMFAKSMRLPLAKPLLKSACNLADERLRTTCLGLDFPSPIGLAAGFDKNARWFNELSLLGFGSIEVGTVTPRSQPGNDKPRIFRLPQDQALINRLGFNNEGAKAMADRLRNRPHGGFVLGINLGKNKTTPNDEAVEDYLAALELLHEFADYIALNVSSPNTAGLRDLQHEQSLRVLLEEVHKKNQSLADARSHPAKPVLVKIAPDLDESTIVATAGLALETGIAGVIATNTTISRAGLRTAERTTNDIGAGGLSGSPLTARSRAVVTTLFRELRGQLPIIGVGGIMTVNDAWAMLESGANLLQVYTGFVYGGPRFVARLHMGLLEKMERTGIERISEIVGRGVV